MDWRDYTSLYKPSGRKSGRDYFESTEKKADEVDSDDWRDYVTLAAKPQKTSNVAQRNKTDNSALAPAKASELYYTGSRAETPEGLKKRISVLEAEKKKLEDIGSGYVYLNQKNPNSNEIKNIEREISELENKKWKNKKAADLSLNTLAHSPDYSQLSKAPDFGNSLSADSRFRAVNNKGWQKFLDESEGVRASGANYKYMTAEEVSNFNYLYNKLGKEKAGEYLDYLEDELDSRYQTDYQGQMSEYSREHPIAATIGSTVNNIMGGPIGTIDLIGQGISNKIREGTGQDKKPINFNSYATTGARTANTIRGTIASDLNEKGTINIPILGAKGLGDLYQLGTSMLDSYAVGLAAGGAGSFVLGSSAAVNGMIEAKERGLSDEEAVGLGTLNGIAETAFEYLSLDKLIEIKDAKTIKDFVKNVAKQGLLFEGTEEAATTIANTISDVIITGDKNKLRESVNEYMSMGLSEKEAYKKAVSQWFSDLLWDYIGGALTGGFMGGAQTAIQNTMRNSEYNYTGKEIMASEDSMSGLRESLEKYTDLEQLSENPTAKEVGRAYYGVMEKYDSEARQAEDEALNDIAQAAKNRVMELSAEDENSTDIAAAVEKSIKEEKLSKNEAALLKKSETARAVMDELGKGEAEWVQPFIYNDDTDGKVITKTEDIKSVSIDKNGSAVVRLADGSEKSYMDVDFADLEVPGIIEAAAQYGKDADKMFQSYMSENSVTKKQNPETFIRQFNNAFEYGKLGASLEYTKKSGVASNLTDTQLEKALLMGQIAKNRETAAKQKAIDEKRAAGIKIKGQLNMDKLSDKTRKNLNADQRASVAFFEKLADYGGLNIIMEESTANAEGEYIMPNGFIDTDGTIHIDVNAGAASIQSDRTFLMYTMSHELTHLIEEAAPEKYKELSDFAVRVLTDEKGLSLEALIQAKKDGFERGQINRMRKDYPNLSEKSLRERITPMSDEAALKEVVADAMQEVLPNSNLIERLASENKTLFEKVKDAILKIINDIKALYKDVKASGAEAAALKSRLDEITELWTAAAQEAIEANVKASKETSTGENTYSIRYDEKNRPFVVVEEDILKGVPKNNWTSVVKKNLKEKFPNGITIGNNEIKIDAQSRQEMTFSKYMKWLRGKDINTYADKLRATDNADEILLASTGWINEGLNHNRKDNIVDFARGTVLLRVGNNDYRAEVIVGTRKTGNILLYDIINLRPTNITKKETNAAITANPSPGADRNTASISNNSIRSKDSGVNKKYQERSGKNVRGEEVYHSRGWLGNEEDNTGGQIGEGGSAVQGEEKTVKEGRRYTGRNSQIYASDSEGRGISQNISERLKGTSIVDENGRPIAVYHSTPDMDFMEFAKGDTGFHFGSETQAKERASKKGDKGRTIKAYLNIKNPLPVDLDAMNWRANSAAIHLWNDGIITEEQYLSIKKLSIESGTDYNSPAAVELRRILSEKGYDGITYENEYEGEGKSYIAFYPEQVVIFDDGKGKQYQERNSERFTYDELVKKPDINVVKAVEYTDDIDRKTIINNGYQSAINAGRIDESGMPSIYVEDIGREVHVSRAAIQHGLDRRLKVQAPLVQNIGEVIKNSIAINEAAPKKKTADSSYLLLGAAKLSDNDIYFASIVVNKFTNEVKSIDVMYSANVKKVESAALDGARASGQKPLSLTDSKISVADALDLVKDYFANVLPMDVLNHYGIERTESEFAHRLKYQERQDVTADRRGFVKLLEKGDLSESERKTLNKYSGYIDTLDKYDRDLNKLQGEINEIFFGKGQEIYTDSNGAFLSREEYLNELIKRRDSLRDEVAKWDGKIVKFEAMDVMKSLILKEKSMSISKYRMERNKTQVRQRIRAIVKNFNSMLAQPDKKRYIPVKLVNTVISLCEAINFENPRFNSENIKARLEKAKAVYEGYKNDSTYQHVYDEDLSERISEVIKIIGNTPLVDMSEGQLTSLYNLLKQLQHTVTNARQTFAYDSQKDIFEIGDRLMNETANAAYLVKGEKVNELLNMQLTPEKFFNRLGGYVKNSAWSKVADMFTKGTENSLFVQRDFQYFFKDFTENEEIESFTDTKNLVDVGLKDGGGKSIKLTRGMMLSLYMHLKNKQNVIALLYGGTTVPGIKKYYNGKIADAYARGSVRAAPLVEGIRDLFDKRMELLNELEALSEFENDKGANEYTDYYSTGEFNMVRAGEIQSELSVLERQIDAAEKQGFETAKVMQKNIEGMLTPFEKKFIERAKEWYDVKSRDYINGVTLKMYGIKKAGIVDYYTIHRDTNFINTEFVSVVNDMSIENWGALNVRVKSTAPVLLTDIIFELDNHVKKLSAYVGFAAATRDFKLLYNVKGKGHLTSVKEAVLKKFGAGKRKAGVSGEAYIENFMADLSGKVQSQPSAFAAVRRNLARSALSINLRVAASQIAATFSAMGEAGWKATLKGMGRGITRSFEKGFLDELEQKNVWFWSRRRGMGGMREFSEMKDGGNIFDKAYNWVDEKTAGRLLNWCQAVDVRSTAIMYSIAEVYVENELKLKKGMEGYDSQVNQTFSDLLRKTQPNNLTTEMSDIFRDKRETYKALTMFKSQNNQFFNMWFDSTARYRQYKNDFKKGLNGVTEADVKKAGDTLAATTFTVAVINPLAYGVLRFAANAVLRCLTNYRDDDDEVTVGAILKGIADDAFNSLFGVFLMGDELYEIFTSIVFDKPYYGLTEPGISAVGDLIGCVMDLGGEVKKAVSGEENDLTSFELYNKLLKRFSIVTGIPYANTKMIYDAVNGYIHDFKDGGMFTYEYGLERSATTQGSRMYKAILSGDTDKYEAVYDELYESYIEKGKNESDAASQTRTALKGVIREEYQDGKISEEKAGEILEGYFDMDEDDIYWQFDEWKYKAENKGDYSRYSELNDAVISGDKSKVKEQFKYFDKHGVEEEDVNRQITAYIGKLYKNGEMSKETAKNRLVKLRGMSYSEARKKIKEWDESEEEAS